MSLEMVVLNLVNSVAMVVPNLENSVVAVFPNLENFVALSGQNSVAGAVGGYCHPESQFQNCLMVWHQ
ncbi:hypothetical protein QQP08_011978 [Theobroma cacao]|nr:hypothetical protein QQP08_011978 [Theobroma cacao]